MKSKYNGMYRMIRRCVTLIEMMIVMFLIAMIIGVVAYNYQGTLEEGKAFKTKAGKEKLETILTLAISENPELKDNIDSKWKEVIKNSPLVQNSQDLTKDGWGDEYEVKIDNDHVKVYSRKYAAYSEKNRTSMFRDSDKK